jgi:hypothetical protein
MASGFVTSVIGCLFIMFYPKQKLLFSGIYVDDNLQLVQGSRVSLRSKVNSRMSSAHSRMSSINSRMSSIAQ